VLTFRVPRPPRSHAIPLFQNFKIPHYRGNARHIYARAPGKNTDDGVGKNSSTGTGRHSDEVHFSFLVNCYNRKFSVVTKWNHVMLCLLLSHLFNRCARRSFALFIVLCCEITNTNVLSGNSIAHINKVTLHWAWLVLGWVTVCELESCLHRLRI